VLIFTAAAALPHLVGNTTPFRLTVMMMVTGFGVAFDQALQFYWFMGACAEHLLAGARMGLGRLYTIA
jgi:hypothetical protein